MTDYALGLAGCPLGHSLSPQIHAAALAACGLRGEYRLYETRTLGEVSPLLAAMRRGEIHGLNVTIPHKQAVIPLLDALTPEAEAIGAVNTIILRDGALNGHNTDAGGFMADLRRFLDGRPMTDDRQTLSAVSGRPSALVLGAGGSARAVVYALARAGWRVAVAARRQSQAEDLKSRIEDRESKIEIFSLPITAHDLQSSIFNFQSSHLALIVNTTPLGMTPNVDASPWPADLPFPPGSAVYDLVYNPRETLLVRDARRAGLPAATGYGMLVEQALLAFEIWTGCAVEREQVNNVLRETGGQVDRWTGR